MFKKICGGLVALVVLAGCASHRDHMAIDQKVLSQPSKIVIAQISGLEKPEFHKAGGIGLLDMAINGAMTSQVQGKIEEINATSIVEQHYYSPFSQAFQARAFTVSRASNILQKDDLKDSETSDLKFAPYDFRDLKQTYGAQYALVLQPNSFGSMRPYDGVRPLQGPSGHANIRVYLVKLEDNSLVGYYSGSENILVEEWDTPPEYGNLCAASRKALEKVLDNAYAYLIKK